MQPAPAITRIFAKIDSSSFVGRTEEVQRLLAHGRGESVSKGLALLARPGAGSTELLAQVYERLFYDQETVIPFFYRVTSGDITGQAAAKRFLHSFLTQTVAFRRGDPHIIEASPELKEISEMAAPLNTPWIERLVEVCQAEPAEDDERAFLRHCLSSPMRAVAGDAQVLVIIDEIQEAMHLEDGHAFLTDLLEIFERSTVPVVICGQRRFLYDLTTFPTLRIENLSFTEAGRMIENEAKRSGVSVNDHARDLIAVQLGCSPAYISSYLSSAQDSGAELTSFAAAEQLYTDEVFGGRLSRRLDSILGQIATDEETQSAVLDLLRETIQSEGHRLAFDRWKERLDAEEPFFENIINDLYHNEIINLVGSEVTFDVSALPISDYVEARSSLEANEKTRALLVGETTARNVKRAPILMAQFHRRNSSLGLSTVMKAFDGRQISPAVIDYTRYREELKGVSRDRALKAINEDNSRMRLPKCVFSAHTSAYYPRLDEICEPERSVTAICISDETERAEIAWIAAEIDSKLEATRETADFWCDRLEMVAIHCNFENYQIWLVAPEGFDSDALAALAARGAIGSSRAQVELLAEILLDKAPSLTANVPEVYEFVVPMGGDTEMIAAHTIEEIARRHDVPSKAINQIKTALVEACINASEHSLSPDRRIYQTFSVEDEKITITVANRGLPVAETRQNESAPNSGRRGWGLKLIKGLMDEVWVERLDDGTRVTMVKYVRKDPAATTQTVNAV